MDWTVSDKVGTFSTDGAEYFFATLPVHEAHVLLSGVLRRHLLFADEALVPDRRRVVNLTTLQQSNGILFVQSLSFIIVYI